MVVEGVFSGLHQSPHHGSSVEFAEHKEYTPGDEVRHLDWRLYAKSNKLYVKRFEHETNLRATILLDASGSMDYGEPGVAKWDYARLVAATVAYLLLEQRDAVGLALVREAHSEFVPARADRGHLRVLTHTLEQAAVGGPGRLAHAIDALAERLPPRGLVLILSDALEDLAPLLAALRRLRHRKHDVTFVQVLHRDELELPFDELTLFTSLEDETEILSEPRAARTPYLEALRAHCNGLADECRAHEIDYQLMPTDQPMAEAIIRLLAARNAGSRGVGPRVS